MIGAGKSGLIASKVLKQRGIPFDCFEAASQVWWWRAPPMFHLQVTIGSGTPSECNGMPFMGCLQCKRSLQSVQACLSRWAGCGC